MRNKLRNPETGQIVYADEQGEFPNGVEDWERVGQWKEQEINKQEGETN